MCDNCSETKQKQAVKKMDYFAQVNKILQSLQISRQFFTKKQLCTILKGKNAFNSRRGKQS